MKDTEFAYAVARIRANENKLLSQSAMENLITASDYKDAVKILSDCGYGDFLNRDEQQVLTQKQREAFQLICESAPDKRCMDFLIVKNDFHNFKTVLKCMITKTDCKKYLLYPCVVDTDVAINAIQNKKYELLPHFCRDAVREAYDVLTKTLDGQSMEIMIDRACIEASVSLAKDSKDEFAISLSEKIAFLNNVKIALRSIRTNKDKNFLDMALAQCDIVNKNSMIDDTLEGIESLCTLVYNAGFARVSESIKESYAVFERVCDDTLVDCVKDAKYKSFGIAPLVAYYFAVESEIKSVRIIVSCKKNGVAVESIRERVRKLYV